MKRLFLFLCLFNPLLPLSAAEVHLLYETEVTVPDRSAESRADALAQALEAVLVKVSGQSNPGLLLGVDTLRESAPRYVLQYRYRNLELPPVAPEEARPAAVEEGVVTLESEPLDTLALWVRFDKEGVDRLLHGNDLPVWGDARPMTLAWLAVQRDGRRYLVGAHDQGPTAEALKLAAEQRALPLSLPLLDLQDQSQIRPADVWGGFAEQVLAASQRYASQAVLIGRLEAEVVGDYRAHWTLYQGRQFWEWQSSDYTFAGLVASGVDGTAERLSRRFVDEFQFSGGPVALRVAAVGELADYRRTSDYLAGLHGVKQVQVAEVTADAVTFLLQVEGSRENVVQTIALGNTLIPEEEEPPLVGELRYRLLP